MKKLLFLPLIVIFIFFLIVAVNSHNSKTTIKDTPVASSTPKPTYKGVSLSPKSFSSEDFSDFFIKAKEAGNLISWAGDFKELSKSSSAPFVLAELAKSKNYEFLILTSTSKKEEKDLFINLVTSFTEKYKPKYLGLGVEINYRYEGNITGLNDFSDIFSQSYDTIKVVSPNTKVFTVFQLEKMKGLSGGLFGGTNDPLKNQWDLLNKFSKSDLIGFTTYPGIIFKDPKDIPDNYYDEIKTYTQKPIAFTEIGWPSDTEVKGWNSSQGEQSEFINRFFLLSKNLEKEILIWPFLYDPQNQKLFNSLGLIDTNNSQKTSWHTWINN